MIIEGDVVDNEKPPKYLGMYHYCGWEMYYEWHGKKYRYVYIGMSEHLNKLYELMDEKKEPDEKTA